MVEEKDNDAGVVKNYEVSVAEALKLAKEVMKDKGADEFKEGEGYVIGSFYLNLVTVGSYCGVYPVEKGGICEVRVLSRRKNSMSMFTGLTENSFHAAFAERLGALKR